LRDREDRWHTVSTSVDALRQLPGSRQSRSVRWFQLWI
jgi:hypothetical protein